MGLHAAVIRLSPLIYEGEQRYKPYKVGDPRMVTPPLKNPGYAPGKPHLVIISPYRSIVYKDVKNSVVKLLTG